MLKFMCAYGSNVETVLGEILLYVFLEQALDAPKIMTKLEINELNGGFISKSDGVHLLREEISGQPFHQLVFGASDITGQLKLAIDRAFEKIIEIENNYDDELKIVDSTCQWTIYDPEATKFMVELMTPNRNGDYKPDMAFGAFLGYEIVWSVVRQLLDMTDVFKQKLDKQNNVSRQDNLILAEKLARLQQEKEKCGSVYGGSVG